MERRIENSRSQFRMGSAPCTDHYRKEELSVVRALLADHHPIVVEGLRRILEPSIEIAGEVIDGRALVAAVEKLQPDIIIAEISLPLLNGIEAVRQIRKTNRKVENHLLHYAP